MMVAVTCLDDGNKYLFDAKNGEEAINKMLHTLNFWSRDEDAKIELCNNRTWCLTHNGKTYGCLK